MVLIPTFESEMSGVLSKLLDEQFLPSVASSRRAPVGADDIPIRGVKVSKTSVTLIVIFYCIFVKQALREEQF